MARLLERVELIAHVIDRGLEQLSDRRYWPCRHVRGPGSHYQPHPFRSEIAVAGCGFRTEAAEAPGTGEPGPGSGPNAELRHMNQEIARVGMRRFTGVYRSGCNLRQTTSSGAALKIELYVPDTMPISRASAKPFKVSPPATRIATRTRTTVKLVMIDRTAVCMMLMFTTCSNESLWLTRRFSRIRSKTTMVSWTEKPTTVSTAVTKRLLISPILRCNHVPRIVKTPGRRNTSWSKAASAEPPNWNPARHPPGTLRNQNVSKPRMTMAARNTENSASRMVSPAIVPPTSRTCCSS